MSSIRVCAITFDWFPFEPRAFRLIRAATDAGCAVDVVCLRQPHQKRYEVDDGVHIYRMPLSRSYGGSLLLTRGVPREKISSIFNSADPKIFPASQRTRNHPIAEAVPGKQPFVLAYHGSVGKMQGLDTAIRAVALAHRVVPEIRLCIKGFGEAAHLQQLTAELGLEDVIIF